MQIGYGIKVQIIKSKNAKDAHHEVKPFRDAHAAPNICPSASYWHFARADALR